jgi:hypothetical protein
MNGDQQLLLGMSVERKGKFGEAICKRVMQSSGVHYIPLCDIENGEAPMAVAEKESVVAPDFDVFGQGVFAYLDAKVKTQSIRWKNSGEVRHGINKRNFDEYQRMGALQNKQCGLFVVELMDADRQWSGTLLAESFLGLGKPTPGFNEPTPKVYWPRRRFAVIGSYSAGELREIANGGIPVDMSSLLATAFAAPPASCNDGEHVKTENLVDRIHETRAGYLRTTCRKCGKWLGDRPGNEIFWK